MDNSTVFYILGGALAVSAIAVSFIGLRLERFPGRAAPLVFLCFAVLVGGATTFAVLNGQDEQEARAEELSSANTEAEEAEEESPASGQEESAEAEAAEGGGQAEKQEEAAETGGTGKQQGKGGKQKAKAGGGETIQLAAEPNEIAFDTTSLSGKAGKVTIEFTNPSALEHNVTIEQGGKELAASETIAEGKTSVSVNLKPGTYTFLCTIPGHAEAGMEGTLTVR